MMRHGGQSAPDMENVLTQIARVLARVAVTEDETAAAPSSARLDSAAWGRQLRPGRR
jgi:hypothetical protein